MVLEKIGSPQDIRKLSLEELALLAEEVRRRMVTAATFLNDCWPYAWSVSAAERIVARSLRSLIGKNSWKFRHHACLRRRWKLSTTQPCSLNLALEDWVPVNSRGFSTCVLLPRSA